MSSATSDVVVAPAKRRARNWRPLLLLVPAIAVLLIFFVFPLLDIVLRSFTDVNAADAESGGNYAWLLSKPENLVIGVRTIGTSLIVTLVCLVLAYPYAYLMTIVSDRARGWLTLAVMMPLWTSILVRTMAWMVLLQDTGPINHALAFIGLGPVPLIRTTFGVGLGMAQVLLPFMVLPLYSALAKIDRRLLTASSSLGAGGLTTFFKVYLPLSRPGIFAGCVTVFILGLGFYIIPSLLGSPQEAMMPSLIFLQVSQFLEWGHGAALGVALLVVTIVLLAAFSRVSKGSLMSGGK